MNVWPDLFDENGWLLEVGSPVRFRGAKHILNLLVRIKVENDPDTTDSSLQNMGLVSYLAGDKQRRNFVLDLAQDLISSVRPIYWNFYRCFIQVEVDEMSSMADGLVYDSTSSSRGPLEIPLIEAVMNEWDSMVQVLIDHDAKLNLGGHCGMTAYGVAKAYRLSSMIKLLEEKGCTDEGSRPKFADWWKGEKAVLTWDEVGLTSRSREERS